MSFTTSEIQLAYIIPILIHLTTHEIFVNMDFPTLRKIQVVVLKRKKFMQIITKKPT